MFAYAGKILHINLTTGQTTTEPLSEQAAKDYLGGIGLGVRLLFDNSTAGTGAYDPDNPIIFLTGPLSGTIAPSAGSSYAIVSKSPATGCVGNAQAHGFFGPDLKRAGYDAVVIKGKAPKLSYLWIDDEKVEIKNAEHLHGATVNQTDSKIRAELGDFYIRVAAIGEAGEKLCRFAAIINDEFHAAGQGGLGGVMGSKNLKAVAVRGTHDVNVANLEGFKEFAYEKMKGSATKQSGNLGTLGNVEVLNSLSALATRNWTNAAFEGTQKISDESLKYYVKSRVSCAACSMPCDSIAVVPQGPYKDATARLEPEVFCGMGPLCGMDQLDAIIKAIHVTDEYGMDGASTGAVAAFAMDLYEHGVITKEQTDGLDLRFGNAEALINLIHKIGKRDGWLGNILAEGTAKAAEIIGKDAYKYACNIKGQEFAGYDLRALKTAALGFSVNFQGAYSLRGGVYSSDVKDSMNRSKIQEGSGKQIAQESRLCNILGSFILCNFSPDTYGYEDLARYYTLATGTSITPETLEKAGARIENLARLFNIREGKGTRKNDDVPYKTKHCQVPDEGPCKGAYISDAELQVGLDDYYASQGWTANGVPTVEQLLALGLGDLAYIAEAATKAAETEKTHGGN